MKMFISTFFLIQSNRFQLNASYTDIKNLDVLGLTLLYPDYFYTILTEVNHSN